MDMKGITWVGNIYEKFEAMCLEVDEIMCQDTVKYVENQVQTVGATMKKFYSDVMQDLLPPSSLDPTKGEVSDSAVDLHDVGIYIKPKVTIKEKSAKLAGMEPLAADSTITTRKDPENPHTLNGPFHIDNLFPLSQVDQIGGVSRENCKGTVTEKSNLSVTGPLIRENLLMPSSTESSGAITSLDKDLNQASSVSELSNENFRVSSDQISGSAVPESVIGHVSEEEIKSKNKITSVQIADALTSSPVIGSSAISTDDCMKNEASSPVEFPSNADEWSSIYDDDDDFILNSGMFDECSIFFDNDNALTDHKMDTLQQINEPKLDETCVLVDDDHFPSVSENEVKNRSYKKKLREIFSKKKSRKQEYERLVLCHGNFKSGQEDYAESSCSSSATKGKIKSPQLDLCESDWELL